MRPGLKLGAYGIVLAASLGVGAVVGDAVGPIDVGTPSHETDHSDPTGKDQAPTPTTKADPQPDHTDHDGG